ARRIEDGDRARCRRGAPCRRPPVAARERRSRAARLPRLERRREARDVRRRGAGGAAAARPPRARQHRSAALRRGGGSGQASARGRDARHRDPASRARQRGRGGPAAHDRPLVRGGPRAHGEGVHGCHRLARAATFCLLEPRGQPWDTIGTPPREGRGRLDREDEAMRRTVALLALLAGGAVTGPTAAAATAGQASATLCVGTQPGCYATLQAAVDAAGDGDTITIARGTFAGGVSITKSLTIAGSGVGQTIIKGGGPVLT